MLAKFYRLRLLSSLDSTLTFDDGALLALRISPWKYDSGTFSYGTTITDDFGFGAGETIIATGEVETTVIDNTSNLYQGFNASWDATADLSGTDGPLELYIEESDTNGNWPSDSTDFDITEVLRRVDTMTLSTTAVDQKRTQNFSVD